MFTSTVLKVAVVCFASTAAVALANASSDSSPNSALESTVENYDGFYTPTPFALATLGYQDYFSPSGIHGAAIFCHNVRMGNVNAYSLAGAYIQQNYGMFASRYGYNSSMCANQGYNPAPIQGKDAPVQGKNPAVPQQGQQQYSCTGNTGMPAIAVEQVFSASDLAHTNNMMHSICEHH